ncbi:MAG: hypothetical protein PVJ52_00740 [Candidatus Woesebacteria bacterium]
MRVEHKPEDIDLEVLAERGRIPVTVRGWKPDPFFLIPPEGAGSGEKPDNEQTGHFPSGYGEFIFPKNKEQAKEFKKRIDKISELQPA